MFRFMDWVHGLGLGALGALPRCAPRAPQCAGRTGGLARASRFRWEWGEASSLQSGDLDAIADDPPGGLPHANQDPGVFQGVEGIDEGAASEAGALAEGSQAGMDAGASPAA